MNERLAWMMDHRDTVSVSHRYADIKTQKISPEGKPKIQLQVCLHDGTSSTFHFVNRLGQGAQIKDRDDVKELLQQLLQKFKCENTLEMSKRIVDGDPSLLQLYRDLVITHVISSEEFWSQHALKYMQKQHYQKQEIGVSGAFLADIKPQTDGCNGLKYNLTADIIECIFKTYPAVRKKHLENVPNKLTESEFWTKFFQSHYFHRDRINAGGINDLFQDCAKLDDQEMKKDISAGIEDPLVDVTSFEDKTIDEGYGTGSDKSSGAPSGNIVHQYMIKRFNQHSIMVLKACQQNTSHSALEDLESSKLPNKHPANSNDNSSDSGGNLPKAKKMRIQEKITYDDLESNSNKELTGGHLMLTRVERYLHGPPKAWYDNLTRDDLLSMSNRVQSEAQYWYLNARHQTTLVNPAVAVSALGELTPGGSLMKGFQEESLAQLVPTELERELKNVYMSLCELFRHFWSSFPPTTPALEAKAVRMHEALHRFHSARLKPFEDRVIREFSPVGQHLTSHLNQMLTSAYRKFATWQQRKIR
ncbi:hypothetical protein L9F63_016370 [Diploptera punctata]|uniref:BSD domain-containing protein n=1 Tax=Diploptera punctata TaxID=6984 RepID=A0AAD8A0Z4_DIPPU|nr:hypothetical protein L9F63_016370 [Diploptera punctata]